MVVTGPVRSNAGWQSATAVVATISGENGRTVKSPDGAGTARTGTGEKVLIEVAPVTRGPPGPAREPRRVSLRAPGSPSEGLFALLRARRPPGSTRRSKLLHQGIRVVLRGRRRRSVLSGAPRRGERLVRPPAGVRQGPPQPRSRHARERGAAGRGDGRHRGYRRGVDGRVPAIRDGAHAVGERPARGQPGGHRDRPRRICAAVPQGRVRPGGRRRAAHGPVCGLLAADRPVRRHDHGRPGRASGSGDGATSGRGWPSPRSWCWPSTRSPMFDVGFQLSFSAFAGMLGARAAARAASVHRLPESVRANLAVSVAATLGTAPVSLVVFGRTSLISPLANLLVVPTLAAVTGLGMASVLLGFVWSGFSVALDTLASLPMMWTVLVSTLCARAPVLERARSGQGAVAVSGGRARASGRACALRPGRCGPPFGMRLPMFRRPLCWLRRAPAARPATGRRSRPGLRAGCAGVGRRARTRRRPPGCGAVELLAGGRGWPAQTEVRVLDVGQGTAVLVRTPHHHAAAVRRRSRRV